MEGFGRVGSTNKTIWEVSGLIISPIVPPTVGGPNQTWTVNLRLPSDPSYLFRSVLQVSYPNLGSGRDRKDSESKETTLDLRR